MCSEHKPVTSFGPKNLKCRACRKKIYVAKREALGIDPKEGFRRAAAVRAEARRLGVETKVLIPGHYLRLERRRAFEAHYAEQAVLSKDLCHICEQAETKKSSILGKACRQSKDHNHANGQWRGVLCNRCNFGIRLFEEDAVLLHSAVSYLQFWETCCAERELYVEYWMRRRVEAPQSICAICLRTAEQKKQRYGRLNQDHCHTTGFNRGLLCDSCNKGLAFFKESPDLFVRAAEYLAFWASVPLRSGLLDCGYPHEWVKF